VSSFDYPPKVVKPHARRRKAFSVVAIADQTVLSETGETTSLDELVLELPNMPPTLFAKLSGADFIAWLDQQYAELMPTGWQWRATSNERDICHPDGTLIASRTTTVIHYFGWQNGNFHKIIDPISMYGHRLDTIWPGDDPQLVKLLRWGIMLRDFCRENDMEVRPTIGGLSAQFLTDRRFYPNARRKVPAATNERAREALPGNHYVLTVAPTPRREFTARYLDQHRAHHYHARTTTLPNADDLFAYGNFHTLSEVAVEEIPAGFHGLYCLDLEAPSKYRRSHWITKLERAFVFSNELSHLLDMGYKVNGIYAAWGSFSHDTGLARYAKWANSQLDHYDNAAWLKPILLATYGTLATRPKVGETIFRLAKRGEPVKMRTGHNRLEGLLVKGTKKLEPRIANVIHRGMIEAATRSESVGLAQWLTSRGHRILSIYADAVMVQDDADKPLPTLPEPWREKATLNHLQFINQQAFVSGEMTKLPGVGRELMAYRQKYSPGSQTQRTVFDPMTGRDVLTGRRI
jgi:hypothetical protein